jgi:hypothetical protein
MHGMLTKNEQQTLDILRGLDYGEDYIAALMGNIAVETGSSFDHTQKQGGGSGYGLLQFTDSSSVQHLSDYKAWLKTTGRTDSKDSQLQFFTDNKNYNKPATSSRDGYGHDIGWRARSNLNANFDKNPQIEDLVERYTDIIQNYYLHPGKPASQKRLDQSKHYEGMLSP